MTKSSVVVTCATMLLCMKASHHKPCTLRDSFSAPPSHASKKCIHKGLRAWMVMQSCGSPTLPSAYTQRHLRQYAGGGVSVADGVLPWDARHLDTVTCDSHISHPPIQSAPLGFGPCCSLVYLQMRHVVCQNYAKHTFNLQSCISASILVA